MKVKISNTDNIQKFPKIITSLIGKNIIKIACGGVHNLILTANDISLGHLLFKCFNDEIYSDIELISDQINIKCHSLILTSRSDYFHERIIVKGEKGPFLFKNIDPNVLKSIVYYLYLDDSSFLREKRKLNQLVDIFKIAKYFF
jgi:hypothetical protein